MHASQGFFSKIIHVYYWGAVQKLTANAVHKHSFFEVCYVAGGTGIYEEGHVAYPLHEGVLFCSRPNIHHHIRDVDHLDLLYVAFELDEKHSQSVHESFSMLVRDERIRAAKQQLSQTSTPIKTIAERCGFSSVHYFSRTFTEAKGIPPAAFRKASRRDTVFE